MMLVAVKLLNPPDCLKAGIATSTFADKGPPSVVERFHRYFLLWRRADDSTVLQAAREAVTEARAVAADPASDLARILLRVSFDFKCKRAPRLLHRTGSTL